MDQETRMRQLSSKELLAIIENSQDYLPEVLAFAEAELEKREIDPQVRTELREEILHEQDESIRRKIAQRDNQQLIWKQVSGLVAEKSRLILVACIFMAIVITIRMPEALSLISFIIERNLSWDWSSTELVLPIILLVIGMFGLFFEKLWAWLLSVGVLSYYVFKMIVIQVFWMQSSTGSIGDVMATSEQGTAVVGFALQLCLMLAPLIILYLPSIYNRLRVPKWAFFAAPLFVFTFVIGLSLMFV